MICFRVIGLRCFGYTPSQSHRWAGLDQTHRSPSIHKSVAPLAPCSVTVPIFSVHSVRSLSPPFSPLLRVSASFSPHCTVPPSRPFVAARSFSTSLSLLFVPCFIQTVFVLSLSRFPSSFPADPAPLAKQRSVRAGVACVFSLPAEIFRIRLSRSLHLSSLRAPLSLSCFSRQRFSHMFELLSSFFVVRCCVGCRRCFFGISPPGRSKPAGEQAGRQPTHSFIHSFIHPPVRLPASKPAYSSTHSLTHSPTRAPDQAALPQPRRAGRPRDKRALQLYDGKFASKTADVPWERQIRFCIPPSFRFGSVRLTSIRNRFVFPVFIPVCSVRLFLSRTTLLPPAAIQRQQR